MLDPGYFYGVGVVWDNFVVTWFGWDDTRCFCDGAALRRIDGQEK